MPIASLRVASFMALAMVPALIVACGSNRSADTVGATGSVTPAKTVIGGIGSNQAGRQLGARERSIAADAEFRALEYGRSGATLDWAASSHRGSIVPGKPYQAGNQFCRPYTHTVYTGSSPDVAKATACRSPDGTWRSVG
jgi:surface antigen